MKLPPVAAPCCANGIQPPRALAPSAAGAASAAFSRPSAPNDDWVCAPDALYASPSF